MESQEQTAVEGRAWWEEGLDMDNKQEEPFEEETHLEEMSGTQIATADLMEPEILLEQDTEEDMEEDMEEDVMGEEAASCESICPTSNAEDDGTDAAASAAEEARPTSAGLAVRDDERASEAGSSSSGCDYAGRTEGSPDRSSVGLAETPPALRVGDSCDLPVVREFVWERRHGPVSWLKLKQLRRRRGSLLKGILGPPKVDGYIREIMDIESNPRSRPGLSGRRYRLGHQLAECIGTCYTVTRKVRGQLTRKARGQLRGHRDWEFLPEVLALLRYASACLCNALHTWRLALCRSLLKAFLPSSHMWLCDQPWSNNCCTLMGKVTARKLQRHVYSSRGGRVAGIIRRELQAGHSCGNFPNGETKDETLSLMEEWVQEGSDIRAEKKSVLRAGVHINRVILAAKIKGKEDTFLKQFRVGRTCRKLRKKEYLLSCDLADAANALIAALKILPPQHLKMARSIEACAHFVCISLFHFDLYRRERIVSGLRVKGGLLGQYSSSFPMGNDGFLFGDDLIFGLKKALQKK